MDEITDVEDNIPSPTISNDIVTKYFILRCVEGTDFDKETNHCLRNYFFNTYSDLLKPFTAIHSSDRTFVSLTGTQDQIDRISILFPLIWVRHKQSIFSFIAPSVSGRLIITFIRKRDGCVTQKDHEIYLRYLLQVRLRDRKTQKMPYYDYMMRNRNDGNGVVFIVEFYDNKNACKLERSLIEHPVMHDYVRIDVIPHIDWSI